MSCIDSSVKARWHLLHLQLHGYAYKVFCGLSLCEMLLLADTPSTMLWVGFAAKGVVYALIGGLACQSAVTGATTTRGADNSPQVQPCLPALGLYAYGLHTHVTILLPSCLPAKPRQHAHPHCIKLGLCLCLFLGDQHAMRSP